MYKVAIVGLGARGMVHARGFMENSDQFELVAICDLDTERLQKAADKLGIGRIYTDAEQMLMEIRPDVFCFATLPNTRKSMIELAVKYQVKGIAFEKPLATSLQEAREIVSLCKTAGIKAVVSHQQKYLTSLKKVEEIVQLGDIGEITKIHATCQAWLSQLGTHYMDYILWISGNTKAKWVVGHVHGKNKLDDHHPSPDYILGEVELTSGIRAYIECGYLSPSQMDESKFWVDNRLTVYGTHGYVWGDTDGRWGAFTRSSQGETIGGNGELWDVQEKKIQTQYLKEFADWLDNDEAVHSCNVEIAYHGYETLEALCISALDHKIVYLPMEANQNVDIIQRMKNELS